MTSSPGLDEEREEERERKRGRRRQIGKGERRKEKRRKEGGKAFSKQVGCFWMIRTLEEVRLFLHCAFALPPPPCLGCPLEARAGLRLCGFLAVHPWQVSHFQRHRAGIRSTCGNERGGVGEPPQHQAQGLTAPISPQSKGCRSLT